MAEIISFGLHYLRRHSDPVEDEIDAGPVVELPPEPPTVGASRIHSPSLLRLPFVTLPERPGECTDWGDFWRQTTLWNDEPTGNGDHARGRQYARDAILAIRADNATSRTLQMIVEAMIERALKRRGKAGRLCRQLSWAEIGFLNEICRIAVSDELDTTLVV